METHVRILGALHIVFGAIGIIGGLAILLFFGGIAGLVGMTDRTEGAWVAIPILGGIGTFVFVVALVLSLPSVIVGFGLFRFRPWGRILGIILSAVDLLHVPFGTALGIYGLWVLLSNETERLFAHRPAEIVRA